MRCLVSIAVLFGMALLAADAGRARVSRETLTAMEDSLDGRLQRMTLEPQFDLLGTTRGVYLAGFGAVFTSEISLIATPSLTPFRRSFQKEEIARIRELKLAQMPKLRAAMREFLVSTADSLGAVPADERIVVGITIFHYSWEDSRGIPEQVVMQAQRKILLDLAAKRLPASAIDTAIHVESSDTCVSGKCSSAAA